MRRRVCRALRRRLYFRWDGCTAAVGVAVSGRHEPRFFFSSRRRHTRSLRDWSSDVCSSDLARVETVSLSNLTHIDGTIVIAAKSYANPAIAQALRDKAATGPVVVLQNGLGVETPFLDAGFSSRSEERRVGKEPVSR